MIYSFNYQIEKDNAPYGTSLSAAAYLAEVLLNRVTSDKPILEYRLATDLLTTGEVDLVTSERDHLLNVITSLSIDNYFKGKLAHPMIADSISGVPTEVKLWQLRSQLAILGMETLVSAAINALPESNDAEIAFKLKAKNAWERADNVYRLSPTVTMLQQLLTLTDQQVDDIFKAAYLIEA